MRKRFLAGLLTLSLAAALSVQAVAVSPGGSGTAETVSIPVTVSGHGVESKEEDGRSYYYILLAEQMRPVSGVEITFTKDGMHNVWATDKNGSYLQVGAGYFDKKGTYQIPVTADMERLEFNLFTEEIPYLDLKSVGKLEVPNSPYAGHYLSVLGDSLSMEYSWSTPENDTDAHNMVSQWWYAAAKELGMNLLLNNSMGGSGVYKDAVTAEGTVSGTSGLLRCTALHTAVHEPDDIFVLLGINDIMSGCTPEALAEGYQQMVRKIQVRYPEANIVLFTYPHIGTAYSFERWQEGAELLNEVIRKAAADCGVKLVDLTACGFTAENIGQYLRTPEDIHYNQAGQALLGRTALSGLLGLGAGTAEPASQAG